MPYAIPCVGAFLTGVFPGVIFVRDLALGPPGEGMGVFQVVFLHLLLAGLGSLAGLLLYVLHWWTTPTRSDILATITIGAGFGMIGFTLFVIVALSE